MILWEEWEINIFFLTNTVNSNSVDQVIESGGQYI